MAHLEPMNSIIPQQAKASLEEYAKVRAEVRKRFAHEKEQSGFWSRLVLWWRFEREVWEEMRRRFPPGALYSR
jgi:hypothetical protein